MTEAEWMNCKGPMLDFLLSRASHRKLRLFACACSRRVWNHLWSGGVGQQAITIAKRYADGIATIEELDSCRQAVHDELELYPDEPVYDSSYWACARDIQEVVEGSSGYAANLSTVMVDHNAEHFDARCEMRREEELAAQCSILLDLFGPLLFRPINLDRSWLTWNDGTVVTLAQAIYENRRFANIPILADALEEAGCTNIDILSHCRGPGPHVRSCWVVDLLLGRERSRDRKRMACYDDDGERMVGQHFSA